MLGNHCKIAYLKQWLAVKSSCSIVSVPCVRNLIWDAEQRLVHIPLNLHNPLFDEDTTIDVIVYRSSVAYTISFFPPQISARSHFSPTPFQLSAGGRRYTLWIQFTDYATRVLVVRCLKWDCGRKQTFQQYKSINSYLNKQTGMINNAISWDSWQ